MNNRLYLLLGYPGAGKTTISKIIQKITGAQRLSSDEIRFKLFKKPVFSGSEHKKLYNYLNHQTKDLLAKGFDVVYDANLNRYKHRQEKYKICKITNSQPLLIWVTTSLELSKNRATHQNRNKLIPPNETALSLFNRITSVIEPPKKNEPVITIDGTKVTVNSIKNILKL